MPSCYNRGCGQKFDLTDNNDDSCTYHPGAPIFHDAYKGWSCCNKKSTDFTTFLNMQGCTKGKHNPEKPILPKKEPPTNVSSSEVIIVAPKPPPPALSRPEFTSPLEQLKCVVSPSLIKALETEKNENANVKESKEIEVEGSEDESKIRESCKNSGCKASYEGKHSNLENCYCHPGVPIFHEGLKYWSCCTKKTTEFSEFLQQAGCTTASHVWKKKATQRVASCRYDWHQTPTCVYVTIYAKNPVPEYTYINVNPVRLNLHIMFMKDKRFDLDLELVGIIDPKKSSVTLAATKVEVKMGKAEPVNWSKLNIDKHQLKIEDKDERDPDVENLNLDTVDLSDL